MAEQKPTQDPDQAARVAALQRQAAADYAKTQSAANRAEVRARQAEARIAGNDSGSYR